MRQLQLWSAYTRKEAHEIFEPLGKFTPQAGTWGLQGIVKLAKSPGDFVFFVTFGTSQGDHDFDEEISQDGVLTWQSQPKQKLSSATIQQLVSHNDLTNSVHLFLRTSIADTYTYFGQLGYLHHDPLREQPVFFAWQLMNWPAPQRVLDHLGIRTTQPANAVEPLSVAPNTLTQTAPPVIIGGRHGKGGGNGGQATLPGQDAKNRKLGLAGEKLVMAHEIQRLIAIDRGDLAAGVVHVSVIEGDSAGYDIRSFSADGTERHIEVKTTAGPASNAFYISPNEIKFSRTHSGSYVLMRLSGYSYTNNSANYYEVAGDVSGKFDLTPSEFRARLWPQSSTPE